MIDPIQRIVYCRRNADGQSDYILMASGPSIYSFDASTGTALSKWTAEELKSSSKHMQAKVLDVPNDVLPAEKRRKLDTQKSNSPDRGNPTGQELGTQNSRFPLIGEIQTTANSSHVVVFTGEDKCVRVFSLYENGGLEQLSKRTMPKRPNALALTEDQTVILCGDKFGDVYSLPLLENDAVSVAIEENEVTDEDEHNLAYEVYAPAANKLTVHSKRNLEALRSQEKHKGKRRRKAPIKFEHQLLLGHVSLLTDVLSATVIVDRRKREYIITSDRDEHIRISRGIPQAYIIENYCLGHSQFVSKLCIPPWRPDILVSGGGDNYILVWDWVTGEILQKIDLSKPIKDIRANSGVHQKPDESLEQSPITLVGIRAMRIEGLGGQIVLTFEGTPALLTYSMNTDGQIEYQGTLITSHNVIDVAIDESQSRIIYTMDNSHKPMSTSEAEISRVGCFVGIQRFSLRRNEWIDESQAVLANALNSWAKSEQPVVQNSNADVLSDLLYNASNLRKWVPSDGKGDK